jgi:hypothetical protein
MNKISLDTVTLGSVLLDKNGIKNKVISIFSDGIVEVTDGVNERFCNINELYPLILNKNLIHDYLKILKLPSTEMPIQSDDGTGGIYFKFKTPSNILIIIRSSIVDRDIEIVVSYMGSYVTIAYILYYHELQFILRPLMTLKA